MKITELNPKFIDNILTFDCPSCTKNLSSTKLEYEGREHRIRVPVFPASPNQNGAVWEQSGNYPDSLTIYPSINAGCWHGWIKNGDIS